jgi:hypothetical protein
MRAPIKAGKAGPLPPLNSEMLFRFSRARPEISSEAASRKRAESLPNTVQWLAYHKSAGTERTMMSGTIIRSAQPSGEADPVPGNQEEGEDRLLVESMLPSPPHDIPRSRMAATIFSCVRSSTTI